MDKWSRGLGVVIKTLFIVITVAGGWRESPTGDGSLSPLTLPLLNSPSRQLIALFRKASKGGGVRGTAFILIQHSIHTFRSTIFKPNQATVTTIDIGGRYTAYMCFCSD